MKDPHQVKVEIGKGPPEGGLFREAWATLRLPIVGALWHVRTWWLLHRGIIRARRWRSPMGVTLLVLVLWLLAAVLAFWLIQAIITVLFHRSGARTGWYWGTFNPDGACRQVATSCDAINSILMPVLLVAATTVIFLAWRLFRVKRYYRRRATTEANRVV